MVEKLPLALILEDEVLIALDMETSLAGHGFDVFIARTCVEAEAWLRDHSPAVAILDIVLMDGSSARVANQLADQGVPFIVHSGALESDQAETVFAQGLWVGKPVGGDDLAMLAQGLLSNG